MSGCTGSETATTSGDAELAGAFERGEPPVEHSGWTDTRGLQTPYPKLSGDRRVDVAVVGAGLAGSSVALHLAEAGVSVAVLEARQPGWGASGRNAGHVLPTLKDLDVFKGFPDQGQAFMALFRDHHTITFDLARQHQIDCDAVQSGYLHATERERTFEKLKDQSRYWQNLGHDVQWLQGSDMQAMTGSSYYPYGVLYKSGGRVNPYLFTNGLIAAAVKRGAQVFGDTPVTGLSREGQQWRVTAASGSVLADRVVFCTNAYSTSVVPAFSNSFYPLTAYGVCTQPLPAEALKLIMPSRATLAQEPIDLNPFMVDGFGRIVTSSIPKSAGAADASWHFEKHLKWIHRTWPQAREFKIEMAHYWTGRVALRDKEFPGVYELEPGVYGLMHFNAWGNVMAPLLGRELAQALARDRLDSLPFPLESPMPVSNPGKQNLIIRKVMIPAARTAQGWGWI